jgi:putative Mg2+ transporter-C (MgtC) family protein
MTNSEVILRIFLAISIGGIIGYEREMRNRPAGFITNILVCVGAAVVSLIQVQMVENTMRMIEVNPEIAIAIKADFGRIVSQAVTGIGFLGAGTIIYDKGSVKGLTSAATIWVVAVLGLAVGLGYYRIVLISSLGVIFIIVILKKLERSVLSKKYFMKIDIVYNDESGFYVEKIIEFFNESGVSIKAVALKALDNEKHKCVGLDLDYSFTRNCETVIKELAKKKEIIEFKTSTDKTFKR